MATVTAALVASVLSGERDGVEGLAVLAAAPAVALGEGAVLTVRETVRAAGSGARRALGWLRRTAARALRAAAEVLDPADTAPVAEGRRYDLVTLRRDTAPAVPLVPDVPVVLPMRAAAQVTEDVEAPALPVEVFGWTWDYAALLAEHGTVRAAARATGIAESTFRSRCKRLGVAVPGRKGKR
jgi:hypothetical protein